MNILGWHFVGKLIGTMLSKNISLFLLISIQLFCYNVVYINSDGGCYYISDQAEDWFEALKICQLVGRCLASISTPEIFERLTKHLEKNSKLTNVGFWSGINSYEKNVFAYVEDSSLVRYVPHGVKLDPEDSCVYVKLQHTGILTMRSDLCCEKKRFICADATSCNKRKLEIRHTLVLERANEKAEDICQSLNKHAKGEHTSNSHMKNRSGNETINEERKKKTESIWNKLLNFILGDEVATYRYSASKSWVWE